MGTVFFLAKKKSEGKAAKIARKKGGAKAESIDAIASDAERIFAELSEVRPKILENERIERRLIEKKIALEDELAGVLRKNFAEEGGVLARIKKKEEKKQASLKERISSLERIIIIYGEKKSRLEDAKKRKSLLERELKKLAERKKELYSYA